MTRGGRRKGAGRPKGTGKFGEPTKAVRLPISYIDQIMSFIEKKGLTFPLYETKPQAGYPSQTDELTVEKLDLGTYLVPRPSSTCFVQVVGDSMTEAGIFPEDVLIVDRGIEAKNGDIVLTNSDIGLTVRRLSGKNKKFEPETGKFSTLKCADPADVKIWGVVRHVIHKV